jgi:hypothetical protein
MHLLYFMISTDNMIVSCVKIFPVVIVFILQNFKFLSPEPGYHSQYSDWLWAGRPRGQSSSPGRAKNFLFSMLSRLALEPTQPPIQWIPGALSQRVKRQGHEVNHSPPASTEIKKIWIYIFTPPYAFMA